MDKNSHHNPRPMIMLLLAAMLLLGGCSGLLPRSRYVRPEVSMPSQWQEAKATGTAVAIREQWWRDFNDPTLSELIERALRTNNNLAAATIKVRRTQLTASLIEVVKNPYAALGAALTLPFIQWNTMKLNVEISKTDYEEAVVNFRQTLYSALSDVENALSARTYYAEEGKQLEESLALARRAEQLVEVRYRAGSTALQSWLDAQESWRDAERALSVVRLSQLKNCMTLYQALGGAMSAASRN